MNNGFKDRYFWNNVLYPKDFPTCMLTGVMYEYVGSDKIAPFLKDATVVAAWLIHRYIPPVEPEPEWVEHDPDCKSKPELVADFLKPGRTETQLNQLGDDVLYLGIKDGLYYHMWLDHDVSDCVIGRFETEDPLPEVIERFDEYVRERCVSMLRSYQGNVEGTPEQLLPISIPVSAFVGEVKFF
jgi:hypothetical protein